MGEEIAKGLAAETPAIEAEVAKYGKAVAKAEEEASAARKKAKTLADAEAKALGALRVAQEKLQESYAQGSQKQAQASEALAKKVEEAQRKVEAATKKSSRASDIAARSTSALAVAQQRLNELHDKGTATQSQLLAATDKVNAANEKLLNSTNAVRDANVQLQAATEALRQAEERALKGVDRSTSGNSQLAATVEKLNEARAKASTIAEQRAAAEAKVAKALKVVDSTTKQSVQAQQQLVEHQKQVRAELERTGTAWERLSNSISSIARGRPMGQWAGSIARDSNNISKDLDNMAVSVEQSGTRGGRAFTRGMGLILVSLTGIVPVAGSASAALVGTAGAVTTLAGSFSQLGGVAALIPAALVNVGAAAGTLRAAFSGIGEALQSAVEVDDRIATMGQNPRIMAMAVEDAMQSIVIAEENAAESREAAARRVGDAQRALSDTMNSVAEAQKRAARTVEQAERRVVDAARRVADAQRQLQRVVESVAEAREDAARSVEMAQRREARAARDVLDAQKDLNEARKEAADRVKEVADELSRAQLRAKETALAVSLAQGNLAKGQADPASSRGRLDQLELAVARAQQADETAKQNVKDLVTEQKTAKKEAVTASEAVLDAERRLEDARLAQADAIYERKEAEEDAVRAARDGAEQVANAQQAITDAIQDQTDALRDRQEAYAGVVQAEQAGAREIADAQRDVADAVAAAGRQQRDSARAVEAAHRNLERTQLQQAESAAQAGENSALAMSKLTPAAQLAVTSLLGIYERLQAIQRIAQENFFTGMVDPLERLADVVMPQLETGVGLIATALGGAAQQLLNSLSSGLDQGVLTELLTSVATSITILSGAIDPLVQSFITLSQIGMPYMEDLATWIAEASTEFNTFIQGAAADGSLNAWIDAGIQGFKDIGSILSSTKDIFSAFNDAARAGGIDVTLGSVADSLNRLQTIMEGPVFQDTMATIFTGAREGMEGLAVGGRMIADAFVKGADAFAEFQRLSGEITGLFVGGVFQALANPEFGAGLTTFLENVKLGVQDMVPLMPGLTEAFGKLLTELGPLVRELGPTLVEVFTFFADSIANVLSFFEPLLEAIARSPHIVGLLIAAFLLTAGASAALTAAANLQKVATAAVWVVSKGYSITLGLMTALLGRNTAGIATNTVAMRAHGIATKVWQGITKGAIALQNAFNFAMKNNPIGMVIAAIGLVVAALVHFFTQTELGRQIWANVWGFITETATAFGTWWTEEFWPGIMSFFENLPSEIERIGTDIIRGFIDSFTGGRGQEVIDAVRGFIMGVIDWFKKLFGIQSPSTVFRDIGYNIIMGLLNGINSLKQGVLDIWNKMIKKITDAFEFARKWLVMKLTEFQARWHLVWTLMKNKIQETWDRIVAIIKAVFTVIVNWVRDKIENFQRNWERNWGIIGSVVKDIWEGIKTSIRRAWEFIRDKIIQPLINFVTKKIPEAFEKAKDGISKAWNKIQEIAKKPVDFVVKTIINKGLIGGINSILPKGLEIDPIPWPPKGWRKGGYTGKGNPDEVAGQVHKDEFVFNSAATNAIGKDRLDAMMSAAMHGDLSSAAQVTQADRQGVGAHPYFMGNVAAIKPHGAYYMNVGSGLGPWNFPGAARLWDGASGLKVRTGRGQHQGNITEMDRGGGILGYTTGTNIDMSAVWKGILGPKQRLTVAAHEVGHAIGLPHDTTGASIMAPLLHQMAATPTRRDIAKLQYLYPGGSGEAGQAEAQNPIKGLVEGVMKAMKEAFPESSMFVDVAGGVAMNAINTVSKWIDDIKNGIINIAGDVVNGIKDFFGVGARVEDGEPKPLLRDTGGYVPPGLSQVLNHTGGYEYINTPQDMKMLHDIATQRYADGQRIYNVQLPERATVDDLITAVNFEERRVARGGRR